MMSSKEIKKRVQHFKADYKSRFPGIKESQTMGSTYAFCSFCVCDFVISHGGKSDIDKHIKSAKHKNNCAKVDSNTKVSTFLQKSDDPNVSVIQAECLFTEFLVEHNIPLTAADHAGPLFKKMFPDSSIAKQYSCARTKTTAIVDKMATINQENVIAYLKKAAFSVAIDGSNDTDTKLYPIVVTYYNDALQKIITSLLCLPNLTTDSTGENIANLLFSELDRLQIPISNLIAFGSDNAAVMIGQNKGVYSFIQKKQEEVILIGCPCHLINLAAEKASVALPVNIDKILIDAFY